MLEKCRGVPGSAGECRESAGECRKSAGEVPESAGGVPEECRRVRAILKEMVGNQEEPIMKTDLSGTWSLWLEDSALAAEGREKELFSYLYAVVEGSDLGYSHRPDRSPDGEIKLPGILQAQGYGNPITEKTPWVSGLHDPFWYEREEYQYGQEDECAVPFLSQPPKHYIGRAWYEREITVDTEEELYLFIELTHWRSDVWVDGTYIGSDSSLCTAHEICLGSLNPGRHILTVCIDNRFQHPYRPDGHGVSDALGATWNGMAGEICLVTGTEKAAAEEAKRNYAAAYPRHMEIKDGKFYVDGRPEYFRGTHFGGDYPLTGYPSTDPAWWKKLMDTVKEWGLNFIRCHSCCPPEAAFAAADEAGVYLQPECGMWNIFEEGILMNEVLKQETRRILRQFGHHPSFVLFSPTNEPGGQWYEPLRRWVAETREYDESLGYGGRRLYTAQSGWFYDLPPKDVTGTDYLYFHRSAYGPYNGGNIRNKEGWKGKDYSPSLEDAKIPAICHEMGQWCAYPDFSVMDKFTGYLQPGNYRVFRENARAHGLLERNQEFAFNSGKNQVLMYKEDIEANLRTPELYGFEMLDLHDYLGQGTALVGVLDAFWENKGYIKPEEFRRFCNETVVLARIPSYTYKNTDRVSIPVEVCHFGKEPICGQAVWKLTARKAAQKPAVWQDATGRAASAQPSSHDTVWISGLLPALDIPIGGNTSLGRIELDFSPITENTKLTLTVQLDEFENSWDLYVYAEKTNQAEAPVLYTRNWQEAAEALEKRERVVYSPYLTNTDYLCPPASMLPVFWNAQMGPTWGRSLGLVMDENHPLFQHFPTDSFGGWQWEDILDQARAFNMDLMPEGMRPIITVIDDWNRNLPLALAFEGKVGDGRLLVVTAALEGSFEERPAAWALKQAVLSYAASKDFDPKTELETGMITGHLYADWRCEDYDLYYMLESGQGDTHPLKDMDPGTVMGLKSETWPISFSQGELGRKIFGHKLMLVPDQKDRLLTGCIRDYKVICYTGEGEEWRALTLKQGTLKRSCVPQVIDLEKICMARMFEVVAESGYANEMRPVWTEEKDGWHFKTEDETPMVRLAGYHLIEHDGMIPDGDDEVFWKKNGKSRTKEIEN